MVTILGETGLISQLQIKQFLFLSSLNSNFRGNTLSRNKNILNQ